MSAFPYKRKCTASVHGTGSTPSHGPRVSKTKQTEELLETMSSQLLIVSTIKSIQPSHYSELCNSANSTVVYFYRLGACKKMIYLVKVIATWFLSIYFTPTAFLCSIVCPVCCATEARAATKITKSTHLQIARWSSYTKVSRA